MTSLMPLLTGWGEQLDADHPLPEYPRPQLVRDSYLNLNGRWQYAITGSEASPKQFDGDIVVPFSPEAPLSGVTRQLRPDEVLHYRRPFRLPEDFLAHDDDRVMLHFGAVDQWCRVSVNGAVLGEHTGGYLPFRFDSTDALHDGDNELAVVVRDPSDTGPLSRGKQRLERGGIWYTAQSGIWQTVWLEAVPATWIDDAVITPDLPGATVEVLVSCAHSESSAALRPSATLGTPGERYPNAVPERYPNAVPERYPNAVPERYPNAVPERSEGALGAGRAQAPEQAQPLAGVQPPEETQRPEGASGPAAQQAPEVCVEILAGGRAIARASGPAGQPLRLSIPDPRPWSPEDPFLYDVIVTCGTDTVRSYVGMRSLGIGADASGHQRLLLNGEPYFHAGVLDQGYWPDGLYTPPSDAALAYDIAVAKELGFTMIRKHIKVEPLRWYAHCDRLGILVWQDMVNGGGPYSHLTVTVPGLLPRFRLDDHQYGRFGRGDSAGRQHWLREAEATVALLRNSPSVAVWVPFNEGWGQFDSVAVTARLRELDPARPIDAASGWHDQGAGDFDSRHVYVRRFRPNRRRGDRRVLALTEYGGYSRRLPEHSSSTREFGYRRYRSGAALARALRDLHQRQIVPAVHAGLAATVYTQLVDVEDETNGLMTADRRMLKLPLPALRTVFARLRLRPPQI